MASPSFEIAVEDLGIRTGDDAAPLRRGARSLPLFGRRRAAERSAELCLGLFLTAALGPGSDVAGGLGAALFAQGAADAAARHAALGPAARARLERALLRTLAGSRRRGVSAWRRTLGELGHTPRGSELRRCGEEALHAWLGGDEPAPRLAALLGSQGR